MSKKPKVTRPPLRYHGGKFRMADKIIPLFPPHLTYVEPFGGGEVFYLENHEVKMKFIMILIAISLMCSRYYEILRSQSD